MLHRKSRFLAYLIMHLLIILLLSQALVHAVGSQDTVTTSRSLDDIRAEVTAKLDLGNPHIADTAITMAADYPGVYNMNQVSEIYNSLAQGGWFYFSDPTGSESYQNANLSLQRGKIKNTIGMGDCDDFAILMASVIQSIGGSARVIFAYDIDNQMGHAYSELYLGHNGTNEVAEILSWIKREYGVKDLLGINKTGDEIWLNLDWGSDITKAAYPGGPYFGEGSKNVRKEIMWQPPPDEMVPPTIVPMIDSMDSTEGWCTLNESKGSTVKIESIPGKKAYATQLLYDLREGGWIGIFKEIDPYNLSSVAGLNFSYFMMEKQNTIEMRLVYDDGTAFGASWSSLKTNSWQSQNILYADIKCLGPGNKCGLNKEFNTSRVKSIEFIISNNPDTGDKAGTGIVILDEVRGLKANPVGSPWARAEEQRKKGIAYDLASKSQNIKDNSGSSLPLGTLLAVESLRHYKTENGYIALQEKMKLLPPCIAYIDTCDNVEHLDVSPAGNLVVIGCSNYTAQIWNLTSRMMLSSHNHSGTEDITFNKNGTYLAFNMGRKVRVWETNTFNEIISIDTGENNSHVYYCPVDFSYDGRLLAFAIGYGTIQVWDISSKTKISEMHHDHFVSDIEFSHDGEQLASSSRDGTARVWDVKTGEELRLMLFHPYGIGVSTVSFCPANGSLLSTTSSDSTARLWDLNTGEKIANIPNCIGNSAVFSSDGRLFASGTCGGSYGTDAYIYDTQKRNIALKIHHEAEGSIISVAFSPNGDLLATGNDEGIVRIWDSVTGREIKRIVLNGEVNDLEFLANGTEIATASSDGIVAIWDLVTEGELSRMLHNEEIFSAVFSSDGERVLTLSYNAAKIWDTATGKEIARINNTDGFQDISAFSPNGSLVAASSNAHIVQLCNTSNGKIISNLRGAGNILDFSRDGRRLATKMFNVTVWDTETGKEISRLISPLHGGIYIGKFSPDGKILATAEDHVVYLYNSETGKEIRSLNLPSDEYIKKVDFSHDGKLIAILIQDYLIKIWSVESGRLVSTLGEDPAIDDGIVDIEFSPNLKHIAICLNEAFGMSYYVQIRDVYSGELARGMDGRFDRETGYIFYRLAFSPNGALLALSDGDGNARTWNASTGQELASVRHKTMITSMKFNPNATLLTTVSQDGHVGEYGMACIWNATTGEKKMTINLSSGDMGVSDAFYAPDENTLLTSSFNQTLQAWNVKTGKEKAGLNQYRGLSYRSLFSPDGKVLAAEKRNTTTRIYNISTYEILSTIEHDTEVRDISFNRDSSLLATACSEDNAARIWNLTTGMVVASIIHNDTMAADVPEIGQEPIRPSSPLEIGYSNYVVQANFDPTGTRLITKTYNYYSHDILHVSDIMTQKEIAGRDLEDSRWDVAFTSDGMKFASCSSGESIEVFNISDGQPILSMRFNSTAGKTVRGLAFGLDGRYIATWTGNGYVSLWNAETGRFIFDISNEETVDSVAFSSRGELLAIISGSILKIWNMETKEEIARIDHGSTLSQTGDFSSYFSPDLAYVLTISCDTVKVWPIKENAVIEEACRRVNRNLTLEEWRQYLGSEPYRETCACEECKLG
jgi:WD40 repeat protein